MARNEGDKYHCPSGPHGYLCGYRLGVGFGGVEQKRQRVNKITNKGQEGAILGEGQRESAEGKDVG